ncbi:MAG: tripartite tricarboxylate transporter permease [Nitrososphaerales archaeon]|nr:tripartite tricarboxylate transporter permease [Nitrososphaerales archaeon]
MIELFGEWSYFLGKLMENILSPLIIGAIFVGALIGYVVGVLPGLTAVMGMSLLLGFCFRLPVEIGLALLIGIYTGAMHTGGITSILVNIPGTPAAAATTLDGFPLAKKGKAREAIGAVITASMIGEVISAFILLFALPIFSLFALMFGDWEVFLFCMYGILIVGALSGKDPVKGWISGILGLFFAIVGLESLYAYPRFTFGLTYLEKGISFIPALIGLFGLSEVLAVLKEKEPYVISGERGFAIINFPLVIKNFVTVLRSTLIGLWIGFIPGIGESVSPWVAYDAAKRSSKNKEEFGKGSFEGVIAAEVADNTTLAGALFPTLVFGIPGSGPTAVILAALFIYGVRPGPLLLIERPGFLSNIVVFILLSSIVCFFVAYLLSKYAITLLSLPREILFPIIIVLCILGSWGVEFTIFDIFVMFIFGIIGYFMKVYNYPIPPMVLGILIGEITDLHLRRALLQYSTDPLGLFIRPMGLIVTVFIILLIYIGKRTVRAHA